MRWGLIPYSLLGEGPDDRAPYDKTRRQRRSQLNTGKFPPSARLGCVVSCTARIQRQPDFELLRFKGSTPCCCEQLNKGFYVLTDPVEDLGKAEFVPVH